jgi:gluconokinase
MIIVLFGVSGSGKSTVGNVLAEQLGWPFLDADDFHPEANIEKMKRGEPLTDADREPWLESLARATQDLCQKGIDVVLACSALKHAYRKYLQTHDNCIHFVYLHGSEELIQERLKKRKGHFMPPGLLHSQFEALEPPKHSIEVDVTPPPEEIAQNIREKLGV